MAAVLLVDGKRGGGRGGLDWAGHHTMAEVFSNSPCATSMLGKRVLSPSAHGASPHASSSSANNGNGMLPGGAASPTSQNLQLDFGASAFGSSKKRQRFGQDHQGMPTVFMLKSAACHLAVRTRVSVCSAVCVFSPPDTGATPLHLELGGSHQPRSFVLSIGFSSRDTPVLKYIEQRTNAVNKRQ